MRRLSILAMTTFVLAAAACGSDSGTEDSATTTTRAPDSAQAEQFQAALDDVRDDFKFPGVVARVITADYEWTGSSGTAGRDSTEPPTASDHTRIGSITKTFVATVVLQLEEEGLLSIEDPLSNWLPDAPHASEISLRQLLDVQTRLSPELTICPTPASSSARIASSPSTIPSASTCRACPTATPPPCASSPT